MARIRLAYLGGGSTRAAGTMAAFIHNHGQRFAGSEIVLIDLDPARLDLVRRLSERMSAVRGLELRFETTVDQRAGLTDVDAVLSSYRPGGFQARVLDEQIPLRHGIIGQETQGPGGFFMALRSIYVLQRVLDTLAEVAPNARIFNYTNPVNIVAQAATLHADVPFTSFCEGTYDFPMELADAAGLDREKISARMVGLNHTTWSVSSSYAGATDAMPAIRAAWDEMEGRDDVPAADRRFVELAVTMDAIPAQYLRYYYYRGEMLAEMQASPTTRSQDILKRVPDYWEHYAEQAEAPQPSLDPERSRGGIFELELALDAIDSYYNDLGLVLPVNVPNEGAALPGFDDDTVVEVFARVDKHGFHGEPSPPLPRHVVGLIEQLAEYQRLTADAAWAGTRRDAVRALASHPWLTEIRVAEALYDEMASAHREHLPERLLR
ncbi:MAG: glycoside hydrolase [Candidatus Limnocylindrales bacterium]